MRPTRASSPAHPELLGPRRPPGRTSPNPRAVTAARPPSTQGRGADGQRDPSRGPPTLPPAVGRAPGPRVNELGGRRPESAAGAGAAQGRQGRPREPAERAPHAGQVSGGETRHSVGVLGGPGNSAPPLSFLPSGGGRRTRSGVQTRQNHGRTRTRSEEKPVHGGQRHAGHGVWGERHVRPGLPPGNPGQVSCSNVTSAGESPAPSPSIPISAAVEVGRGRGAGGTARGRRPRPSGPARPRAPCTWRLFSRRLPAAAPKDRQVEREGERRHAGTRPALPGRPVSRLPLGAERAARPREERKATGSPGREHTARGLARAAHLAAGARAGGGSGPAQLCPESQAAPTRRPAAPTAPPAHTAPPGRPSPGVARGPRGRGRLLAGTRSPPARAPPGPPPPPRAPLRLHEEQQVPPAARRQRACPPARLPSI